MRLFEAFERLFDHVDVLVVPITSLPPPFIDSEQPDEDAWNASGAYTTPFNLLGAPSCALRAGFDEVGLPVGAQVVGRYGSDALVLAVADAYYEAMPELQGRWPVLPTG